MILKFEHFSKYLWTGLLACTVFSSSVEAAWEQPPHQFPVIGSSNGNAIATNASGNAIAVPDDTGANSVYASSYSLGVWSPLVVIGSDTPSSIDIALEDSGTALVIWYGVFTGNIRTAFFDGLVWSTPSPDPLDLVGSFSSVQVAVSMNGPGEGVAIWNSPTTLAINSSFFSGGSWTPITQIGTGFTPSIAYSTNGTVVAGWSGAVGGTMVANYTGGTWQAPIVLDPTGTRAQVGIDSAGNALAVWLNTVGNIVSSTFNGVTLTWSAPQIIDATPGNQFPSIGMSANGTAVVVYSTGSNTGLSISYNGTAWSAPIQFTPTVSSSALDALPSVSVTDNGNALVLWVTATEIRSSRLPLGGAWTPEVVVTTVVSGSTTVLDSALSEDGTAFSAWTEGGEGSTQFASVELAVIPTSPSNLQGYTCTNRFASQSDRVNILSWTPSADPTVVAYNLRRNGVLIATIPALAPNIYRDHNRCKVIDVYTLTAVDGSGVESAPISIELI